MGDGSSLTLTTPSLLQELNRFAIFNPQPNQKKRKKRNLLDWKTTSFSFFSFSGP